MTEEDFVVEGIISDRYGERKGWIIARDGLVTDMGDGECPEKSDVTGFMVTDVLNMHTHCADYGLKIPPGLSLEELVSPPNGLKHRYLRETEHSILEQNASRFAKDSRSFGSSSFVDFREGGIEGCRMLRMASPESIILGRPISPEFDPQEIEDILEVADGIGISSISDMEHDYIESIADMVRERQGIFAIHASERIREDMDFILSLDPAFVVHMCEATDSDIAKCAEAEVPIVVCPTSNRYFGRTPPIARAQAIGADLALGTDNGMLCVPDPFQEASIFMGESISQGGDPYGSFRTLTRLFTKILNHNHNNPTKCNPAPLTVLPSPGLDVIEALGNRDKRIQLNIIGGLNNGF